MSHIVSTRDSIIETLPASLQVLMELERFHLHNVGSFQDMTRDPDFDVRFLPQNCGPFRLPCFWVSRRHLFVFGKRAEMSELPNLFEVGGASERVLFPVHPLTLSHLTTFLSRVGAQDASRDGLVIWAVPTSSTRTLLAWREGQQHNAYFVKTSLQSRLFGDRRLSATNVGRSVGASSLLDSSREDLPRTLSHFPEPVGFVPRLAPDSGVIIRRIPTEIQDSRVLVAPLFSLFGGQGRNRPLLLTMADRIGAHPLDIVTDVLCAKFALLWLQLSIGLGLILEAHGQDLLLALGSNLVPLGRFYYRDLEGLQIDWELRQALGLWTPADLPQSWAWQRTYVAAGRRYQNLISYNMITSLQLYLQLVLEEVGKSLHEWQQLGLIAKRTVTQSSLTTLLSTHMMCIMEQTLGISTRPHYDIYSRLTKFALHLMDARRMVMANNSLAKELRGLSLP